VQDPYNTDPETYQKVFEAIHGGWPACPRAEGQAENRTRKIGVPLRRDKTSVSQEDYLKAIWEMLERRTRRRSARVLAESCHVTHRR